MKIILIITALFMMPGLASARGNCTQNKTYRDSGMIKFSPNVPEAQTCQEVVQAMEKGALAECYLDGHYPCTLTKSYITWATFPKSDRCMADAYAVPGPNATCVKGRSFEGFSTSNGGPSGEALAIQRATRLATNYCRASGFTHCDEVMNYTFPDANGDVYSVSVVLGGL
jgi:hypothetical protein